MRPSVSTGISMCSRQKSEGIEPRRFWLNVDAQQVEEPDAELLLSVSASASAVTRPRSTT